MSNVYPLDQDNELDDPAAFIISQQRRGQFAGMQALEDDPAQAGRALDLEKATGTPAPLIYGDQENFEKQHKAALTAALLRNNQYLSQYAASDPMAAKVSANDWGQLHKITEIWDKFTDNTIAGTAIKTLKAQYEGFKGGFGTFGPPGSSYLPTPKTLEEAEAHPYAGALAAVVAMAGFPREMSFRIGSGLLAGAVGGAKTFYQTLTGDKEGADKYAANFLQTVSDPGLWATMGLADPLATLHENLQHNAEMRREIELVQHHVMAGENIPVGLSKTADMAHAEQAKIDDKVYSDLLAEVNKAETKEISADHMARFANQKFAGKTVGIDAEAIRKLYGTEEGKPIEFDPEDNKLGWVPNIREQMDLAEKNKGRVEVPFADWLARVDPEVEKELHDSIALRRNGMTLEQAKAPAPPEEAKPEPKPPQAFKDAKYIGESTYGVPLFERADGTRLFVNAEGEAKVFSRSVMKGVTEQETPPEFELKPSPTAVDAVRQGAGIGPVYQRPTMDQGIIPAEVEPSKLSFLSGETNSFPAAKGLEQVDKEQLPRGISRELARFFEDRLNKIVGDVPVHIVPPEMMQAAIKEGKLPDGIAFYDAKTHSILFDRDYAEGKFGHPEAARILYHEMWHAFTYHALEQFPDLKATVRQMMDEVDEVMKQRHLAGDEKAFSERYSKHYYAMSNEHEFLSAIGSEPAFQKLMKDTPVSEELAKKAKGVRGFTVWDMVRQIISEFIERLTKVRATPNMLDAVLSLGPKFEEAYGQLKAEGKLGKERGGAAAQAGDVESRIRGLMNKGLLERYMEKITKQQGEDAEFQRAQALKRAAETQTKEWEANEKDMRQGVREELQNRPDIAVDNLLRKRDIDPSKLSSTQADTLAEAFSYTSGDRMLDAVRLLREARELEGLTPAAHLSKLVDVETERKMRREYGTLDEQILKEAEDHVISPTQIDLLHDKLVALGMAAKIDKPLESKANMQLAIRESFNAVPNETHSVAKYLADTGRAGNDMRDAFLKDDIAGAFKAQQNQLHSLMMANEAKKLEKLRGQFDRKVKTSWSRRDIPGVPQRDAVWIHHILMQIEEDVGRTEPDLDRQKALVSAPETLRDYVKDANQMHGLYDQDPDAMTVGQRVIMEPLLYSANWRVPVDKQTPAEFRSVFDSLKSIDNFGRSDQKETVKGNKEDLGEVVSGLIERLKAAVNNVPAATEAHKQSAGRLLGSWLLNPETWFKRLDLGNRMGPFNQLLLRPITEGQYTLRTYERNFAKRWRDLGNWADANKKIDNTLFRDNDGDLLPMKKKNAYAVLSNMGNRLQREKLIRGWKIADNIEEGEQKIWQWLQSVGVGKEDLARAQKLGGIFNDAFELSEKAYTHTAGVAPARIDLGTVQTPWGEAKEWYHPLIPDPLRHSSKLTIDDMQGESGYWRPSPAAGYTKTRTGAIYPIDLSLDSVPFKLKQILNDAAMRIPITEVSKIVYHPDFQAAFKKYYGPEYASALDAWMKDAAGNRNWVPSNLKALDLAANSMVRNLSTLQIGFNLGTVGKHAPTAALFSAWEVGFGRFADSLLHMIYELPGSKERWRFAFDSSEELQNRLRHVEDTLIGQARDVFTTKTGVRRKLENFKDAVEYYGHYPVGMTDLLSAVAMWDGEYRNLMKKNPDMSHGDAVYAANTAVRQTHGSSILTNRPGIMRYNSPFVRALIPYYNFMSNALQRNYELGWIAKLTMQGGRELPEMVGFEKEKFTTGPKRVAGLIGGIMVFGVMVGLIEQMIDPLPTDPDEYKVWHWAKILTRPYAGMIPAVREVVNGLYGGHDPSLGLYGTVARNVADGLKPSVYVRNPGEAFHNANRLFGTLTGRTYEPVGKAGKFYINVLNGIEHPKGMGDLFKGTYHGKLEER